LTRAGLQADEVFEELRADLGGFDVAHSRRIEHYGVGGPPDGDGRFRRDRRRTRHAKETGEKPRLHRATSGWRSGSTGQRLRMGEPQFVHVEDGGAGSSPARSRFASSAPIGVGADGTATETPGWVK